MTVMLGHCCFQSISFHVKLPSEWLVGWTGTRETRVAARSFRILIPQSSMRLERWRTSIGYQVGTSIGRFEASTLDSQELHIHIYYIQSNLI